MDKRTNLYYLQTDDLGRTWHNVRGETVDLPLSAANNFFWLVDALLAASAAGRYGT